MIVVVDYGRGNLFSLRHALLHLGVEPTVTDDPAALGDARAVILPGVGAFGDAMAALGRRGLIGPIRAAVGAGVPLLGICLGLQVLAERGEEFGVHEGLGLVPGIVRRLPAPRPGDPLALRIPNVGWRGVQRRRDDPLLRALGPNPMAYFVHSYGFYPAEEADAVALVRVNGETPAAIVRRGSIVGCQFHPEKSGSPGLALLNAFLAGVRASPAAMRSADAHR